MPKRVSKIPSAGDKKRKEVSVSANNGSSPPKKRVRKLCSVGDCTNQAKKGGLCIRHGAKLKRCSVDDCTNQVMKGGVCWTHGAKVKLKRCSVDECTKYAQKGGVCIKHGAKLERCSVGNCTNQAQNGGDNGSGPPKKRVKKTLCRVGDCTNQAVKGGVCIKHGAEVNRCSVDDCKNYAKKGGVCVKHGATVKRCSSEGCTNQAQIGGVCIKHGAKVKQCSVGNCTKNALRRGLCTRHGAYSAAPPAQVNFLCGNVQGGADQNNASAVVEISDNEGEGGKNQSPIAGRKRKADNVGKQQSETAASNDAGGGGPGEFLQEIPVNKEAVEDGQNAESDKSSSGVANLKDDSEQDTSDMRPQKRVMEEVNLKDDKEQDASDVASTQGGGEGGTGDAIEDGDSWGGDGQNEYDCGRGDDGDVNSEEGKQSHVVPDEIVATDANDVENDSEIQRLATELKDANNTVDTLNDRLKEMSNEFEAAQSRSKSEHEQQQSELKDLRNREDILSSQLEKKTVDAARLETSLRSKEVEIQSAVLASAAQLKEANDKVDELSAKLEQADKDGNESIQRQINNFHSMLEEKRSLQSKILRLEQQLRSSKSEQDNLKSALAKAASKNQTHCTRSTSITSSRKGFSKKNRLVGVDSLYTLEEEGTTSITSSSKRRGKKNRFLGVDSLQQMML